MRAVIQRVSRAAVRVGDQVSGSIATGFLVLLGVGRDDQQADAVAMAAKIAGLRVFEDEDGRMNRSLADVGGAVLVVSQFTLFGDCRKGRRPSFVEAADPARAEQLYGGVVAELRGCGLIVETGVFRTHMQVDLQNDGPVTLLIDTRKLF